MAQNVPGSAHLVPSLLWRASARLRESGPDRGNPAARRTVLIGRLRHQCVGAEATVQLPLPLRRPNAGAVALVVSVAIHLLLAGLANREWVAAAVAPPPPAPSEPSTRPIRFEIVETSEAARTEEPSAETELVSNRTARAQEADPDPTSDADRPAAPQRDVASRILPSAPPSPPEQPSRPPTAAPTASGQGAAAPPAAPAPPPAPSPGDRLLTPSEIDALAHAREAGSFSYAAVEHFFADYLLDLRRQVEAQWTLLLVTDAQRFDRAMAAVEFRVQPDGQVSDLHLVEAEGGQLFPGVCIRAIRRAAPFGEVPYDRLPPEARDIPLSIHFTFRFQ